MPFNEGRILRNKPKAADGNTAVTLRLGNSRFLQEWQGSATRTDENKFSADRSDLPALRVFDDDGPQAVLTNDALMLTHQDHWLVRETIGALRRTLARLDVSSRSLFALVEPGSAFAGTLAEIAFAADRTYMLALPDDAARAPKLTLNEFNFGFYPLVNDQSRLQRRFYEEVAPLEAARAAVGQALDADAALALGLVTAAPDDIDWEDELRMAIEERVAMSPDALTGLEANLRFASKENMNTRIFGRLTAWQNWIFNRPNAVGPKGALKVYGTGEKAGFDMDRV